MNLYFSFDRVVDYRYRELAYRHHHRESSMEAIYKRRSMRKYTDQPVKDKDIQEIIRAGMNAPSAGNEQPWHFVVINDRDTLSQVPGVHPHANMVPGVQVAVLVCGDLTLEKHEGYWVQDCSACVQNMLLAAAHLGLGSVWLGVYPREDRVTGFRKLLGISDTVVPFALIPLGYPGEDKPNKNEFHEDRIHKNRW